MTQVKNAFIVLLSIMIFAVCKNEPAKDQGNVPAKEPQAVIEQANILLICEPVEALDEETEGPSYEVFLQMAESKVKVAEVLNCESISPGDFEQYQIPKGAISAVGGWWAGAGDYVYVVEEEGEYVIKKGEMYEEKETNDYDYEVIAKYAKNGTKTF